MRTLIVGAMVGMVASVAAAQYPTPEQSGFHHCALIYECEVRGPEELARYVANDHGWLFDAFLFLHQRARSGQSTMDGLTVKADWEGQLDTWFTPGRDLQALDEAIEAAKPRRRAAAPRQVILSIPYPNPKATDFGDVDGDGVSESLATVQGQARVARWYMAEAVRRFEAAGLRNLALWGLYWMSEGASDADIALMRQFADAIHAAGKRILWIPWFMAPNWQRWREMGVDVAIMQPNYAFLSVHHGSIRRNRLMVNARAARQKGLGVEIELPMAWRLPGGPRLFRHYLRDGAADREGYQQATTAYYLGRNAVEDLAASADPAERALYEDLCAYVQNGSVAEPDATVVWRVRGAEAPWLGDHRQDHGRRVRAAEAAVPAQSWAALDVMLHEPEAAWTGLVAVEGRAAAEAPWQPAGWTLRPQASERDRPWQVATVPLAGTWERLRVHFEGGEEGPCVSELAPQPPLFESIPHLACDAPYRFSHPPEAQYGDSGRELTDGRIPETGFPSGETVGWTGPPVAITFDLEASTTITHTEVHLQGGSAAAVNWPQSAIMMVSDRIPARRASGVGQAPDSLAWLGAGPVAIDRQRSERDFDGHLTFRPQQPIRGRYVSFVLEPVGHLMVSEIGIFSGMKNVAAGRGYTLEPPPTPGRAPGTFPDDLRKLTDGRITDFAPGAVVGWCDDEERTIIVDLQDPCRVDEVLVWTLTGLRFGIYPLAEARVTLSDDGRSWREAGSAQATAAPADPSTPCACVVDAAGARARYVRVAARRAGGWAMLSEIEVRGERTP